MRILLALFFLFQSVFASTQIKDLMKEGKWTKAKKIAYEKLKQNPEDYSLYLTIGICALNQKNYNEAIANFSKAAQLNKKIALPKFLLGIIYEEIGSLSKALSEYEKALKIEKDKKKKKDILKHIEVVKEKMKK
ncbi:MAG: tetratricopeptide repeat protein [Elusimicrobia bacterium]|nr:tetratricopeptide repeat protein [Elusimicrobiota bacterium]